LSWPIKALFEVCDIQMGSAPKGETYVELSKGVPLIAGAADYGEVFPLPKKATTSPTKLCQKGDLIICVRATIGDLNWADKEYCLGRGVAGLRPKEELLPEYLFYFIKASEKELYKNATGSTFLQINRAIIEQIEIPLPPLPIQKQIAAVLEKADTLRQQSQLMEQELNSLTQSVFLDMFGDPAKNEKGWPIATIGDCCKSVNYGTSEKADESTGDYPVLRMNNITYDGRWNFDSLKYINLDDKGTEKYLAESGDLLFNRTNSKELVGKTAVFRENKAMAFAGYLVRARLNERAVPEYISAVMNSRYGKQTLLGMCKSIVGMANINAKEFQKIRIPLPPIALQEDFQEIILSINSKMRDIEVNKKEYKNLFNSLMQRAFKGELDLKDVA